MLKKMRHKILLHVKKYVLLPPLQVERFKRSFKWRKNTKIRRCRAMNGRDDGVQYSKQRKVKIGDDLKYSSV